LKKVKFIPPIQVAGNEGLSVEEARRVITDLSFRNAELMHFAVEVHRACSVGTKGVSMVKNLDFPGLSVPIMVETEVVERFRKVGFTYNFLLRTVGGGATAGGKRRSSKMGQALMEPVIQVNG
ncbi:hypothetical protein KI387_026929, partial [Taxus chinensis]